MHPNRNLDNMYPMYGAPSNIYHQQQPPPPSQYGFVPPNFQQMAFSQPTAWMPGAAGASNSGQQGSYFPMQALPPQSNSAGNNLPATASVAAISKERQERYKMEQQRKFKNMGKSFKHTSIDSMLDSIVSSSTRLPQSTPSKHPPQVVSEDDFGDFLQASVEPAATCSTVQPATVISQQTSCKPAPIIPIQDISSAQPLDVNGAVTHTNPAKNTYRTKENDLQAKMLASLDLNAPQKARLRFTPTHVERSRKQERTYRSSAKAADWSALTVDDTQFHSEAPAPPQPETAPRPPHPSSSSWIDDPLQVPLVYKQVLEASLSSDGFVDTGRVRPILLRSQLSTETLGRFWSAANKTAPGKLNQRELYILLALIALAQNGKSDVTVDDVLALPSAPVPDLLRQQALTAPVPKGSHGATLVTPTFPNFASGSPSSSPAVTSAVSPPDDDDFDDFQGFQSVPTDQAATSTASSEAAAAQTLSSLTTASFKRVANLPCAAAAGWTKPAAANSSHPNHASQTVGPSDAKLSTPVWVQQNSEPVPSEASEAEDKYAVFKDSTIMSLFDTAISPPTEQHEHQSDIDGGPLAVPPPTVEPPSYHSLFGSSDPPAISTPPLDQSGTFDADWGDFSASQPVADEFFGAKDNFSAAPHVLPAIEPVNNEPGEPFGNAPVEPDGNAPIEPIGNAPTELRRDAPGEPGRDAPGEPGRDAPVEPGRDAPGEPGRDVQVLRLSPAPALNRAATSLSTSTNTSDTPWSDFATPASKRESEGVAVAVTTDAQDFARYDRFALLKRTNSPLKADSLSVKSDSNSVKSLELGGTASQATATVTGGQLGSPRTKKGASGSLATDFNYGYETEDDFAGFVESPPAVPDSYDVEFDTFQEGTSALTHFDAFEDVDDDDVRFQTQRNPAGSNDALDLQTSPAIVDDDDDADDIGQEPSPEVQSEATPSMKETNLNGSSVLQSTTVGQVNGPESSPDDAVSGQGLAHKRKQENYILTESFADSSTLPNDALEGGCEGEVNRQATLCCEQWEKCLSTCYDVILRTNDVLNTIQSPALCSEVVYSSTGSKFIADLCEVYGVACKIRQSARSMKVHRESLQHLHKNIELAWNNLLAFCPNAPTVNEEIADGDGASPACDLCLLAVPRNPIVYGGATYHAPCANLWINLVSPVLPCLSSNQSRAVR